MRHIRPTWQYGSTTGRWVDPKIFSIFFEIGPVWPELEGGHVEVKIKAAQTKPRKLIRRTCPIIIKIRKPKAALSEHRGACRFGPLPFNHRH